MADDDDPIYLLHSAGAGSNVAPSHQQDGGVSTPSEKLLLLQDINASVEDDVPFHQRQKLTFDNKVKLAEEEAKKQAEEEKYIEQLQKQNEEKKKEILVLARDVQRAAMEKKGIPESTPLVRVTASENDSPTPSDLSKSIGYVLSENNKHDDDEEETKRLRREYKNIHDAFTDIDKEKSQSGAMSEEEKQVEMRHLRDRLGWYEIDKSKHDQQTSKEEEAAAQTLTDEEAKILDELQSEEADTHSVVVVPASGDDDDVAVDTLVQQVKLMQANSDQLELPLQDANSTFCRMKSKCCAVVEHSRNKLRQTQEDTLAMHKQLHAASRANREELEERLAVLKGFNAIALVEIEKEKARVEHARKQLSRLKGALCVRQEQRVAKDKQRTDDQFSLFQQQQIQARIGEENRHIQYVQATQANVKDDDDAKVAAVSTKTAEMAKDVAKETQQAIQTILDSVRTLEVETKKMKLEKNLDKLSAEIDSKQKLLKQHMQKEKKKQKQKEKQNQN